MINCITKNTSDQGCPRIFNHSKSVIASKIVNVIFSRNTYTALSISAVTKAHLLGEDLVRTFPRSHKGALLWQDEVGDTEQAVNETLLENGTLAQAIQSEQDQGGGPDIAAHDQVDDGHQNVGTGYPVEVIMTPFGGEADDHQPPPSSNR